MADALEEASGGLPATVKDLFSGAVGGVAQVLIGTNISAVSFYPPAQPKVPMGQTSRLRSSLYLGARLTTIDTID